MTTTYILWNIFLGALGIAYITYGKVQRKAIPLLGGILLLVLPYLTSNIYIIIGGVLSVILLSYIIKY